MELMQFMATTMPLMQPYSLTMLDWELPGKLSKDFLTPIANVKLFCVDAERRSEPNENELRHLLLGTG